MIFVTVGDQMAFDRLISAMDQWALSRGRDDVVAQIGEGSFLPRSLEWKRRLSPEVFSAEIERAELVVAHAGIGTILACLAQQKRLVVMPRRAHLKETRNDHQVATTRHLAQRGLVEVAEDEKELFRKLDESDGIDSRARFSATRRPPLVRALRDFILRP